MGERQVVGLRPFLHIRLGGQRSAKGGVRGESSSFIDSIRIIYF